MRLCFLKSHGIGLLREVGSLTIGLELHHCISICVAFPFLPTELCASTPTLCTVLIVSCPLCICGQITRFECAFGAKARERRLCASAMIFHLLKTFNNKDQMSVVERTSGGDSVNLLVVGLKGHVLGWRLVVSLLRIFIIGVTPL